MVDVLGIQRIILIASLFAVNAVVGGLAYGVLIPANSAKQTELSREKGQVASVRSNLTKIQVEFSQLEDQKAQFERLENTSFFASQNRREAQVLLEEFQEESGVVTAKVEIGSGFTSEHAEAGRSDHVILKSPLEIEVTAMDDTDVFRYVWLLENRFPGYVDIKSITLERSKQLDRKMLQEIITGQSPEIVSAKLEAIWKTMIPRGSAVEQDPNQIGGRR